MTTTENRIANIRKKRAAIEDDEIMRFIKHEEKRMSCIDKIRSLHQRIANLFDTANALYENSFPLGKKDSGFEPTPEFITDGIHHRVGFHVAQSPWIDKIHRPTYIGIQNGGAYGSTDLCIDKYGNILEGSNRVQDMMRFLKEFDGFESRFYAYVDSL